MGKTEEQAERIMAFLAKAANDRGVMADLRCGFSAAREPRAWRHIAQLCQLDQDWSRLPAQTVCAAYATQPESSGVGNLGDTLRRIALGQGGNDGLASFEGRFRRLLACGSMAEICALVPAIVRAAKAKGVPINHRQLYLDICWWERSDVKIRWASTFWGAKGGEEQ